MLTESNFYKEAYKEISDTFKAIEDTFRAPCSNTGTMHSSCDYAQQVHYPSNPMQSGPIKIFGIICEAIPRQVNYLIDEASNIGKEANSTISFVNHYFANHGLGEMHAHLHAGNCS